MPLIPNHSLNYFKPKATGAKLKPKNINFNRGQFIALIIAIVAANLFISGLLAGFGAIYYDQWSPWWKTNFLGQAPTAGDKPEAVENILGHNQTNGEETGENFQSGQIIITEEDLITQIAAKADPAVVSIIVSKDIAIMERYYEYHNPFGGGFFDDFFGGDSGWQIPRYRQNGTEKQEVGGGTGFIVSADGMIVTNRHVVDDEEAEYTVLANDEQKYTATVLARDSVNDIAILKIDRQNSATLKLGDSSKLKVGQTVIAIGNALGEYRNTVSKGVISGLLREITAASRLGQIEQLSGVIQTDAAINPGNSGGPLLNLKGEVIGVNVAVASAENIGFSLPINDVKKVLDSVEKYGKIVRPWIGVRYVMINKAMQDKNQLPFSYGALILRGENMSDLAVVPGSPADKAGLAENDIILEINGKKLEGQYTLSQAILNFNVGDEVSLKIYHKGEEQEVEMVLAERQ